MKEGQPLYSTEEQLAYLTGVERAITAHQEWSAISERTLRQNCYNAQIELLSAAVRQLGVEFPLVSEGLEAAARQDPSFRWNKTSLELIQAAAEEHEHRGLFVDSFAKAERPKGIVAIDFIDAGVFLLPDGGLLELFYLREEQTFTTGKLVWEDALQRKLPTEALRKLGEYIRSQAENENLISLQQQLEAHFRESDPQGFIQTEDPQKYWEEIRKSRPLAQLFPERGHRGYVTLVNTLARNEIITAESLLSSSEEELLALRGVGPKSLEVLRIIRTSLDLNSSRAQA
jgi:hypothetical protein